MKHKRLFLTISIIVFVLIIVVATMISFTISNVTVKYNVDAKSNNSINIQTKLQSFNGKNLLFFNEQEIYNTIESDPYYKVISTKKSYPNTIEVEIVERQEIYSLFYNEKTYILDETGFVLNDTGTIKQGRPVTTLNLYKEGTSIKQINIVEIEVGSIFKTDHDVAVKNALKFTAEVKYYDVIKELYILDKTAQYQFLYKTSTDVEIEITDAMVRGEEKVKTAFDLYIKDTHDYLKSHNKIQVFVDKTTGNIIAEWLSNPERS